jgi:hypothetical protein
VEPLSKQELEEIIARDLPDHELVSEEVDPADHLVAGEPDEAGADIAALREKFLGGSARDGDGEAAPQPVNEHDQIVAVRPKRPGDPFDHKARPKTVVVSARDKRVIGRQG